MRNGPSRSTDLFPTHTTPLAPVVIADNNAHALALPATFGEPVAVECLATGGPFIVASGTTAQTQDSDLQYPAGTVFRIPVNGQTALTFKKGGAATANTTIAVQLISVLENPKV